MSLDKLLYTEINNQLFENGSCVPDQWVFLKVNLDGKQAAFETILPSRGNIRVRMPVKRMRVNSEGQEIWMYNQMKFTNKKELKNDGLYEYIRLDQDEENNFGKLA